MLVVPRSSRVFGDEQCDVNGMGEIMLIVSGSCNVNTDFGAIAKT